MTFAPETISQAGSGLVFVNTYDSSVSSGYRNAIITAEHQLQSVTSNPVTIYASFNMQSLGSQFAASNTFYGVQVSYAAFANALRTHAATSLEQAAAAGLPAGDPSSGAGFLIPTGEADILGLAQQDTSQNLTVTLNSDLAWTFGQDAAGAIEHEITEGAFGRIGSLGVTESQWAPLDLFRFTASGARDYTGGADGIATYFGVTSAQVSGLRFHSGVNAEGVWDGQDLGDWANSVVGDAFGGGGPASPTAMSATDLQVLQVLGWNDNPLATPGADSLAATGPGESINGGDGADTITGLSGANTLFGGAGNDSISGGSGFDQVNGNTGDDTIVGRSQAGDWLLGGQGNDSIDASASTGNNILNGNLGSDTLAGGSGADSLRGGQGDDVIRAGSGADWISGDLGSNTIYGGQGADTFHAGAGHDYVNGWHSGDTVQVDPGVTWTVTQVNADVHINLSNGGEMDLLNTQQSALSPGWIV
jgi:Ca2+-binding RTX toxin-like protein